MRVDRRAVFEPRLQCGLPTARQAAVWPAQCGWVQSRAELPGSTMPVVQQQQMSTDVSIAHVHAAGSTCIWFGCVSWLLKQVQGVPIRI